VLQVSQSGQLSKRKVLALATHGLMVGDLPRLSQPALAADGTEHTSTLVQLLTL
jgi:hypothetical protein